MEFTGLPVSWFGTSRFGGGGGCCKLDADDGSFLSPIAARSRKKLGESK